MSAASDEDYELGNNRKLKDEHPIYHARKRRKPDEPKAGQRKDSIRGKSKSACHAFVQPLNQTQSKDKVAMALDLPQARPKSKHRIHIPKNPEVPKDGFCHQPRLGSSSPYRIDQFYWQNPIKPLLSPLPPDNRSMTPASSLSNQSNQSNHERAFSETSSSSKRLNPIIHPKEAKHPVDPLTGNEAISMGCDDSHKSTSLNDQFQNFDDILADLPSDAFSSSTLSEKFNSRAPSPVNLHQRGNENYPSQNAENNGLVAPLANLRQTTLFGDSVPGSSSQSQSMRKHNWPLANREEPPTHHKLDRNALQTWVYPTNLGNIREYQYSIVATGLYHNLLVALPTGLGKTFIAATVMLNFFRWTIDAQIVFVAPTKPLVSQQVKACFDIVGIPRSTTTMLTGSTAPGIRAEEWQKKRVFFMTPQTIINDLKTGICDPKRIVLLVVDEAHRATGSYAYVEVVKFLNRFNSSYRVLALTATPGASIEGVQEVIDGLGISRIEIRTEESIDIRQYVHQRKIETVLFEYSEEMVMVMDLFSKSIQPVLNKLNVMNAYWAKDPMTLTPYGCTQARMKWMGSDAGKKANQGVKGMVNTIFSLLASLAHGIELLKFHGIGPFFHKIVAFSNEDGEKGSKYRKQIIDSPHFRTMMTRTQLWINKSDFVGHPKLEYLQNIVLRHFLDAGEGRGASDPSNTRIMVFAHYRDSAEEIARVLKRNDPMIRPHVFVGQANSKGSDGMDQKSQLEVIRKFHEGIYNTLVATSIGEEGLDIGEVDLIICYDASASPIRMLQRMGRTGRKRAGKIVVTLMKGKEEENFLKAKDNYEKMQKEIAAGTRFEFRDDQSRRIVPKDIQPTVDKKIIDIPLENSQAELPEPRRRAKPPKKPPKKFHMPDGVRTGFVKASRIDGVEETDSEESSASSEILHTIEAIEPIPPLEEVCLNNAEEHELERMYLDVKGDAPQIVDSPRLDVFPKLQRLARPTKYIGHGRATTRFIQMLKSMNDASNMEDDWYKLRLCPEDRSDGVTQANQRNKFNKVSNSRAAPHALEKDPSPDIGPPLRPMLGDAAASGSQESLPFYKPKKTYHSDSDYDFPELDSLVKENRLSAKKSLSGVSNNNVLSKTSARKRRRIIDDDSDE